MNVQRGLAFLLITPEQHAQQGNSMVFNPQAQSTEGLASVCLIGIGAAGRQFVAQLHEGAHGPLADLLGPTSASSDDGHAAQIDTLELDGLAILFIAFALDVRHSDARLLQILAHRALMRDVQTIGVIVHEGEGTAHQGDALSPVLREVLDSEVLAGRIDIHQDDEHALQALRWMYGALRSLTRAGVLILEPGWDLADVVEVLELPGAQLSLAMHTVPKGVSMSAAVIGALEDLAAKGVDLALASSILLVLWRAPDQKFYVRDVREASRIVGEALGQGGLHLTLTAPSRAPWGEVGACATVVVSTRRAFNRELGAA